MEINVMGQGEKSYKPNQIVLDINISNVYKNYEDALVKGEESVLEFLKKMQTFGFGLEDFKTVNYQIRDEILFKKDKREKVGVRYTRGLNLKFDYDIKRMSEIIETSSKLKNAPQIKIGYRYKDTKTAEMELFADAYQNAKNQADIIANAAGLKVVRCARTNIENENNDYYRRSCYEGVMTKECASACDIMAQTYTPQDIVVTQQIFCVFVAE